MEGGGGCGSHAFPASAPGDYFKGCKSIEMFKKNVKMFVLQAAVTAINNKNIKILREFEAGKLIMQ